MIQANELRIGNYATTHNNYFYQVTGFDIYKADENEDSGLEPIDLSVDILLRCGFEWQEETMAFADKHHLINKSYEGWIFMPNCTNDVDCYILLHYLHDLQNAYYTNTRFTELNFKP